MLYLSVYVPATHTNKVKEALFAAGAGRLGAYDSCCWETEGRGQFRPLEGSRPFIGQENQTEVVREVKLEMVCAVESIHQVIAALKNSHPYETPAYFVCQALDL